MKDENYWIFDGGARMEGGIRTAAELWCTDPAAAKQQYGPIASWDTSEITNMWMLFINKADFNGDISRGDVSSVLTCATCSAVPRRSMATSRSGTCRR